MGGRHPGEGRLEYCNSNQWETVCSSDWDTAAAEIACAELEPNSTMQGKLGVIFS